MDPMGYTPRFVKKWAERGIIILPETNSSHLKHLGLEDEFPFGKASCSVRTVSFGDHYTLDLPIRDATVTN